MDLLRLITCGNVDDGKSTLLGRLLHDTKSIFEDQWAAVQRASVQHGNREANLAFLTDGLRAERELGITIDVAYRYFATPRRKFILADCPGHFEYTRNMVTAASSAQLALLLLDASRGITEQTRRHAFLTALLRIRHLVVCVNKMDLVEFRQDRFDELCREFMEYADRFESVDVQFIPMAALHGDNVVEKSPRMTWYGGAPLLHTLETVYVRNDANHIDPRLPVQLVLRDPKGGPPWISGQVASGVFRVGDEVLHLPSAEVARIKSIRTPVRNVDEAFFPMSVSVELDRNFAVARGDVLARQHNRPHNGTVIDAMVCWLDEISAGTNEYLLRSTYRETRAIIVRVLYKLEIQTLRRQLTSSEVVMNDLARVEIRTTTPLFWDSYQRNRQTGSFILIDPRTNETVAAGMICAKE